MMAAMAPRALRKRLDIGLMPVMGWASVVFVLLLAGALPQLDEHYLPGGIVQACYIGMMVLWPAFWLEAAVRAAWINRPAFNRSRAIYLLLGCIVPPLRLGLQPANLPGRVWLPLAGFRKVGRPLARRMERALSAPMLVMALMILPVLALEFIFSRQVEASPALQLTLDLATRMIWLAFALELVVLVAASRDKIGYCVAHWIDVAIVILPLISFLRVLRLLRLSSVVRASRIGQIARTYRLRALGLRMLRALLLLRILERFSTRVAEKRIAMLESTVEKRQREIAELQEEIRELREHLAARQAEGEPQEVGSGI